jgi:hypothetical protein
MLTLVKWQQINYMFTCGPQFCFPYLSVLYFHISVKYNYITLTGQALNQPNGNVTTLKIKVQILVNDKLTSFKFTTILTLTT